MKEENDVDALVLCGIGVVFTDYNEIREAADKFENYMQAFGYYELDNRSKYSICKNAENNLIYAKNQHFGWDILDQDDIQDLPNIRFKLAEDNPGFEILLNSRGNREENQDCNTASTNIEGNISSPFRQETYEKNNGCVWLAASLLINSVDSKLGPAMIERYQCKQE